MKIALVHDFIREFGGAERVLRVLSDMFPEAPIYTAFRIEGSTCDRQFADRKIIESGWGFLLKRWKLYSPLRFLIPWVWASLDLSEYDLVITSCSSYIARGFKVKPETKVVAYCHTPPRFLYGYETSIDWQKYWVVRMYAAVVNHFLRIFDFQSAQRVDKWIVNSENVKRRVWKFYRKNSVVINPPVNVEGLLSEGKVKKENYFLIVSRLVGGKGIEEAAQAAVENEVRLKVAGEAVGFSKIKERLEEMGSERVELLGRVSDERLRELYEKACGFIALAKDEDFGITPVEAQAAGTPVIAFDGGGFRETVIPGRTGVFVKKTDALSLGEAMKAIKAKKWEVDELQDNARKYSRMNFEKKMRKVINEVMKS